MSGQNRENISCIFSGLKYNSKRFLEFLEEKADLIFTCHKLDGSDNELTEFIFTLQEASMKILYLQKNKLDTLKLVIPSLTELNLSFNKLYDFPDLNSLFNLELLFLTKNNIEKLETKNFEKLSNLKILEINYNNLIFNSVREFKECIEIMESNHKKIFSIVIDNNTFCHDEVFTMYYAYYISTYFCSKPGYSLRELNRLKVKFKETENVNTIYAVMMEREKKKNERNEKTFNKLDSILEKFMLHENYIKEKLPQFKQLILDFIKVETFKKADFNLKLADIETEDDDTVSFEKVTSKLCIFIEKYDELDNFLIKSYLNFATIRKGRWADIALSFLHHLVENKNKHKELDEHLAKHFERFFVDENVNVVENSTTMDTLDEDESKQKVSIAANPVLLKGFKNFILYQYEAFMKNLYFTIMEKILTDPHDALDECKRKYEEKLPKNKKKEDQNRQYLLEEYFSNKTEKSLTRFYSLEIISLSFRSSNYDCIKKKIKKNHIVNLCLFALLFWNNYYERNYLQKNLNLQFIKILVIFTKIFKVILKNGIKVSNNISASKKNKNERIIDGVTDNQELAIDQKFITDLFTQLKNHLKEAKLESAHINPSNPTEWILFVSELSKQRSYVITNSISENDTKTLEMHAYDNVYIAQLIKISTLLIFLFKDKVLFPRLVEKMDLFLSLRDEDFEKKKIEDKLREEEKLNRLKNMQQNNANKQENNNILENNNQDYSRININKMNYNNEKEFLESPKKFADKLNKGNTNNFIQLMKNKLRDDVSNYNNLETENVLEDATSVAKSTYSKNRVGKKKKVPRDFNSFIDDSQSRNLNDESINQNIQISASKMSSGFKTKKTGSINQKKSINSVNLITYENEVEETLEHDPLKDYFDNENIKFQNKTNKKNSFNRENSRDDQYIYTTPLNINDLSQQNILIKRNDEEDNINIMKNDRFLDDDIQETNNELMETYSNNEHLRYQKSRDYKLAFGDLIRYDPVFFQTATFIFTKIFDEYNIMMNSERFQKFLDNNEKKIMFMLRILNTERYAYRYFCMIGFIYENYSISPESSCFQEINSLSNKFIIKLLNSILRIIFKIIKYETNDELIRKKIGSINEDLNENGRDGIMIKFLNSNIQKVKSNVMGVILNVKYEQIEQSEINDLVGNLEGSNFIETKKESMISKSLIFIIKKLESQFKELGIIPSDNQNTVMIAFRFSIKNLQIYEEERIKEKSDLAMMIALFFINITADIKFAQKFLSDNEEALEEMNTQLIENEINYSRLAFEREQYRIHEISPFFYEKNIYFMDPGRVYKVLSSLRVKPYNYVVFRIFKRMAATLHGYTICNINFNDTGENDSIIKYIEEVFKNIEFNETRIEQQYWKRFKDLKSFLKLIKFQPSKLPIISKDLIFGEEDIVFDRFLEDESSDNSLIGKGVINGVFFKIIDEKKLMLYQKNFSERFEFFLDFINGNINDITIKNEVYDILFEKKFDPSLKNLEGNLDEDDEFDDDSFDSEKKGEMTKNISVPNEFKQNISFYLLKQKISKGTGSKMAECYNYIDEDINNESIKYGSSKDNVYRRYENENVNNPNLRSLLVSAFLRCIYTVLKKFEFSYVSENTKKLMKKPGFGDALIEKLRNVDNFSKLILIVDSTKLKESNNSSKILKIIRRVFMGIGKLLNEKDYDIDKLIHLTAAIIDKIIEIYSDSEENDSDTDNTLKTLIKCCLFIYREINNKDNLARKVISSNLIQIIIMKITSIMQKDTTLIESIHINSDFGYNKIYVEVLMLLSEFMKNEKICYMIIESFNRKIYLHNMKIRKTFVKDLNDLSLNIILASQIINTSPNKNQKILYLTIVQFFNYNVDKDFNYKFLILRDKYIEFYPYKKNYSEFDKKKEEDIKVFKNLLKLIDEGESDNNCKKTGIFDEHVILEISSLKLIYYTQFGNRIFFEFDTIKDYKRLRIHISLLFKKIVDLMIFMKKILTINQNIIYIECPFCLEDFDAYLNQLRKIIDCKEKLEIQFNIDEMKQFGSNDSQPDNIEQKDENSINNELEDSMNDIQNGDRQKDELENKLSEFKSEKIMGLEEFMKAKNKTDNPRDTKNKEKDINPQNSNNKNYPNKDIGEDKNMKNEKNEDLLEKAIRKMNIKDEYFMVSTKSHSLLKNIFGKEEMYIPQKRIVAVDGNILFVLREKESFVKNIFEKNIDMEEIVGRIYDSYEEEKSYDLDDILDIQFLNINEIFINFDGKMFIISALDDRSFILLKAKILNYMKTKKKQTNKKNDDMLPEQEKESFT